VTIEGLRGRELAFSLPSSEPWIEWDSRGRQSFVTVGSLTRRRGSPILLAVNWRRGFFQIYLVLWTFWAMAVLGPNVSRIQYVSREEYEEERARDQMGPSDTTYAADGSMQVSRGIRMDAPPRPGWYTNITFLDATWILGLAFVFPGVIYVVGRWILRGFRSA
jgi:hypothetical protein